MGVNYRAYTVIGVVVGIEELFPEKVVEVRGCKHEVSAPALFCQQCGKPRIIPQYSNDVCVLPGFPQRERIGEPWEGPSSGEVWNTHREGSYGGPGEWVYIGLIQMAREDDNIALDDVPDLEAVRRSLLDDLKVADVGDWIETFGIYTLCESG